MNEHIPWSQSCKVHSFKFLLILKANRPHPRDYTHNPLITDTQTNTLGW